MAHYMTINAVARKLQSSRSHVYLLLDQRRLKSIEVNGRQMVTTASVERYYQLKQDLLNIQAEMRKQSP